MNPKSNFISHAALLAILPFFGGCANTVSDFRNSPPVLLFHSAQSARNVAVCIDAGWSGALNGFTMQPTPTGYTITFVNSGLIYYMADINNQVVGGSTTKYWVGAFTTSHYIKKFGEIARHCQDAA